MKGKATSLSEARTADRVRQAFANHGIQWDRLELHEPVERLMDHLEFYTRATIVLDTFPYNGTTTCEALWMGTPVVTLAGKTHVSRVGASLLTAAGLGERVAVDEGGYVETAVALATDRTRWDGVAQKLGPSLNQSRLTDVRSHVRDLEQAYRKMWQRWCAR